MRYKHITEEREYRFGPSEKFNNIKEVKEHVARVRNKILTNLAINGFNKAVEKVDEVEIKNGIKLVVVLKYPVDIFN